MQDALQKATTALAQGQIVLLYDADGREEETDMVFASEFATPELIRTLRDDAGGLLCTTVAPEHHTKLGLPFLADLLRAAEPANPILAQMRANDIRYDGSKSSFGITVNHRRTYTGIPDGDRALTIRALAYFVAGIQDTVPDVAQAEFGSEFRAPGHCILLNGAEGGLSKRQGHTELSLELARLAGLTPTTTICEMLDARSGKALAKKDAQAYAQEHGLVFLTGQDVISAWRRTPAQTQAPETTASAS